MCTTPSMLAKHHYIRSDSMQTQQDDFDLCCGEFETNTLSQEEDILLESISALELTVVRNGMRWLKESEDCETLLRCARRRSSLKAADELAALDEARTLRASSCVENAQAHLSHSRTCSSVKTVSKRGLKINGSAIVLLFGIVYGIFLYLLLCKTSAASALL